MTQPGNQPGRDDADETPDGEGADTEGTGGGDTTEDGAEPDPAIVAEQQKTAQARKESADRRRELRPWRDLAREFGTPDEIRERLAGQTQAAETAAVDEDKIRRDATRAAAEKANTRIVRAEVRALAAGLFADPADAPLFVDLTAYDVDDDGAVDEDRITDDLRAVLERKPHLAKATEQKLREPRTPRRDPSQGSGRTPAPVGAEKGLAEAARRFGTQNVST